VGKAYGPPTPIKEPECKQKLRKTTVRFLFSYIALIRHESDFSIAKKALLPAEADWSYLTTLVRELDPEHIYPDIDERFIYGELRLSRLNKTFNLTRGPILHDYVYPLQQYSGLFGSTLNC
jgi:hypothetical protein